MIIDSHCHVHDTQFFPDNREEVYRRALEAQTQMIVVATSEADATAAVEFAIAREGVWAVVGVHPHDTKAGWREVEAILGQKSEKIVGIGEIGLDYFYENSPRSVQIQALEEQLQWAVDYSLPVSFHVREASSPKGGVSVWDDFWPIVDNFPGVRGVLHSFTDTIQTLDRALARGLSIGVNGISTFTKDPSQRALFAAIPLEKILLETDAPFLTPVPFRGTMNEPVYVIEVARHQAEVKNLSLDVVIAQTTANTRNLFAL